MCSRVLLSFPSLALWHQASCSKTAPLPPRPRRAILLFSDWGYRVHMQANQVSTICQTPNRVQRIHQKESTSVIKLGPSESIVTTSSATRFGPHPYFMFLNMSSAPMLMASSLTPNDVSSGSAGGGGPFFSGGVGGFTPVPFVVGPWFSFPSGTGPIMKVLFLLPNQLLLFFLLRLGWLFSVAGEPGRSDLRLSCDDSGRSPRNLRTEDGRLLDGLAGDSVLALSLVVVWWRFDSDDSFGGGDCSWCGNTADLGVGCDERGPLPGVGGRGVSGGESGGAGIDVPSVREKLMGVSVRGWYLPMAMLGVWRRPC